MDEKDDDESIKKYMQKFEKEMEQAVKKEQPEVSKDKLMGLLGKDKDLEPKPSIPPVPKVPPTTRIPPVPKVPPTTSIPITPSISSTPEKEEKVSFMPSEEEIHSESERLLKERLKKEREEKERLQKQIEEKRRMEQEKLEKQKLEQEKLEKERMAEKARLEGLAKLDRVISNNMLFIIPSWGELLGYPTTGQYVGQDVAKIHADIVVFFAGSECSVKTNTGALHFIFGLGYYFTKFELQHDYEISRGKYIIDKRILTGIVLSDFVYDHMASSKNVTLEADRDVIVADNVIKVPVDLSFKTEGQVTFIQGALMRNVFIPNKEIILEMLDVSRDPESYMIDGKGHMLLSAHRDYFNKILVSEKMKAHIQTGYMNTTAGIGEITYGADTLLNNTLSPKELQKIKDSISKLKSIYSKLEFDHTYLYSMLKNVAEQTITEAKPLTGQERAALAIKESILYTAEDRITSFIEWPKEFPRNEKEEIEIKPTYVQPEVLPDVKLVDTSVPIDYGSVTDYREPPPPEEKFVLRIDKSDKVESRPLPMPPAGEDIGEIFLYLKYVLEENFEMLSIARAFGLARDCLPGSFRIANPRYTWEMSKIENLYNKKPPLLGLPVKEREELLEKVNGWIDLVEEEKRKERERIEAEKRRLEAERLEKERFERERKEQERIQAERQKFEAERKERERQEKIRIQQEQIKRQREQEQLEFERLEQQRLKEEQIERERQEQQALAKEKEELKRLKAEKKKQAKLLKKRQKEDKKREKQKQKIAQQKEKEQQELERITQEFESFDS